MFGKSKKYLTVLNFNMLNKYTYYKVIITSADCDTHAADILLALTIENV